MQQVTAVDAVVARIRGLCSRRIQWLSHIRQTDERGVGKRAPTDVQIAMENGDSAAAEADWYACSPHLAEINAEIEGLTRALRVDTETPLGQLCATFVLSDSERDLLHVCLALDADPALGSLFAHLQGDATRRYATEALASRLSGHGGAPLWSASGPLARWEILKVGETAVGEPAPLSIDPHIHHFIRGQRLLDAALLGRAAVLQPKDPLPAWPVTETTARIQRALEAGSTVRVWIFGSPSSGRRTFAAIVSAALGGPALSVDVTGVSEEDWPRVFMRAQRQAILSNAALAWHGEGVERRWPVAPALVPLQFIIADTMSRVVPMDGSVDEMCVMPTTSVAERRELWKRFVPASAAWPTSELQQIAERFRLNVGQLEALGRSGTDSASGAREICRRLTRDRMGELGKVLDCPFRREDLTLPTRLNESLDEFLFEARERVLFWENERARRLFPRGTGLVCLMAGPPGTGKTMAAQVIAAELGLDLVRIDLATVVNKYIGETAKNLQRIFARATEMNSVLLFDEADALFTKRTEVKDSHDRYANADTNYLLQLLEEYNGVAILASNKKSNIDAAFLRRLRFVMDFPKPQPEERLVIWRKLAAELVGDGIAAELDRVFEALSQAIELSGAQIKLALLGAIFAARRAGRPLGIEHIYLGVDRELAKDGRFLTPQERERILRNV